MNILRASIKKDFLILFRDKVGLLFMFALPILLVLVITTIQHSTFQLMNENKIPALIVNLDHEEEIAGELQLAISKLGMFELDTLTVPFNTAAIQNEMDGANALIAIVIPEGFSKRLKTKATNITQKALSDFGLDNDEKEPTPIGNIEPLSLYYNPVLPESFRYSIQGVLRSCLHTVENRNLVDQLYAALSEESMPESLGKEMAANQVEISEIPVSYNGRGAIPNATQHNVPAWTIFAMFFMVMSLGSNIVNEKTSGSFLRLKTMPSNFLLSLISKQTVYLVVALFQIAVIFSMGVFLFPFIKLPALNIPSDWLGLLLVSVITGWCAVSYAMTLGIWSKTLHQVNGLGAVSVVILSALGGIMVPVFAMPETLRLFAYLSPLYWCLESYYGLFLSGGVFVDVLTKILPLMAFIVVLQLVSVFGLRQQNLV